MSRRRRPPAVRRHLWSAIWYPLLAFVVFGGYFVFDDLPASTTDRVDQPGEALVVGRVVRTGDESADVRYVHPVTEQTVTTDVYVWDRSVLPRPGEPVRLVVERDNPLSVVVEGDRFPPTTNLPVYVLWVVVTFLLTLHRRFNAWRAERLAARDVPTFAMAGALRSSGWLGHCQLHLYALDAGPNSEPVCAMRVLTTGRAPIGGRTFPVEVKGSPRPLGRVVARVGDEMLWPAGRAFGRKRGLPRPVRTGAVPTPLQSTARPAVPWRPRPWPFFRVAALGTAAAVGCLAVVATITFINAAKARDIERRGIPVVGTVTAHEGEDDVLVLRYERDGRHTARAHVDYAGDFPIGTRYPARIDRDDPGRARLVSTPYNVQQVLVWGALPLAVALWWTARRWRTWRRNLRAARRGPWWKADGRILDRDASAEIVGISSASDLVAAAPTWMGATTTFKRASTPCIVAGDLEPGGTIAIWWDTTEPITSLAGVTSVEQPTPEWRPAGAAPASLPAVVELRTPRFALRRSRMDVERERVTIRHPLFGRTPWTVAARHIGVIDLPAQPDIFDDDPPPGLQLGMLMSKADAEPTLLLLFTEPQRVPAISPWMALNTESLPFGFFDARAEPGAALDGVYLSARDPGGATEALVAAGAERVTNPNGWLRSRRPLLFDPFVQEPIVQRERTRQRIRWLSNAMFAAALVALFVWDRLPDWWGVVPAALMVLSMVLRVVSSRVAPP